MILNFVMIFLLNTILISAIKLLPKSIIKLFAARYVAGEHKESSLQIVAELNKQGFSATLDILGEHTKTKAEASQVTSEYIELYNQINQMGLDCNISIKPSHIGLDLGDDIFSSNLNQLIVKSKEHNNFLRIDMESSKSTDQTIQIYKKIKLHSNLIGTVFQAYLYRTKKDIEQVQHEELNFRLCKGIYKESSDIAIIDRMLINENYIDILRYAFKKGNYVGIATHDNILLKQVYNLINELKIMPHQFEFQVLYGVPLLGWLNKHQENGYKVRIYVPYGKDWYDYSIRRLKENPNIAGYVIKNFFKR